MTAAESARNPSVFRADFSHLDDRNRDGWPDGWRRTIDRDHPKYCKVQVVSRAELSSEEIAAMRRTLTQWSLAWKLGKLPGDIIPESVPGWVDTLLESTVADTCLEIQMNGGAVKLDSPSFPVHSSNAYSFQAEVMTDYVDPFATRLSLVWLDESNAEVGEQAIHADLTKSSTWHGIRLIETSWMPPTTRFAKVRIVVRPSHSQSIQGTVRLDRIRLNRIPRVELVVDGDNRVVVQGESTRVHCNLNEIDLDSTQVRMGAVDQNGNEVWSEVKGVESLSKQSSEHSRLTFDLSLPLPGFYRITARVLDGQPISPSKSTTIAVLPPHESIQPAANPRIGWSMPELGRLLPVERLPTLAQQGGFGRVKFSIWLVDDRRPEGREVGWTVERLASKGIECVGVIEIPPEELNVELPDQAGHSIATLLDSSKVWQPLFEPVLRRASLFLTQFQLGWDHDSSFEQHSQWETSVAEVARHLRTIGAEANLTLPWNSMAIPVEFQAKKGSPWSRMHHYASPTFTGPEIDRYSRRPSFDPTEEWISIDPLNREHYSLTERVRDLTDRMIAVHENRWSAAWINDPHHPDHGILDKSSQPEELYLPLRQLTHALNQGDDFANIRLNEHVAGTLFRVGGEDRMIVMATKPTEIGVYLGDQWTATDIWGRDVPVSIRSVSGLETRFISFGPWPIIIRGIDRTLALWQQEVVIENPTIENRVGLSEPVRVRLPNLEGKPVSGTLEIVAPELLQEGRSKAQFHLSVNPSSPIEIPMKLRYDASQNHEPIDLIVSLSDKPPRQFMVQRPLLVGLKDFRLETDVHYVDEKTAVINLEMLNLSGKVANFECTFVIPNRTRQKFQLVRLLDRKSRSIVVADADELRGATLLLRCEEIGSGRVLNHRIVLD